MKRREGWTKGGEEKLRDGQREVKRREGWTKGGEEKLGERSGRQVSV